jgi:EpsI family protein
MTTRRINIGLASAVVAAMLLAFWPAMTAMVGLWTRSPMYSYAFTVPIISLYLIWNRRTMLATLTPSSSPWLAAPVLAVAALMLLGGRVAGVQVLEQGALLVSIIGVVLALLGLDYLRASWAAIAYLLLMIPVWDGLTERLHPFFQERSAAIGAQMLSLSGVPVHRDGIILMLPTLTVEVARSCSGVNYLIAVLALGLPLAYLSLPGIWRRIALIVAAMLIAALSNGLRVALISLLAYFEIGTPLHGPMHILHGLFVAFVGFIALFVGVRLLTPAGSADAGSGPDAGIKKVGRGVSSAVSHGTSAFRLPVASALAVTVLFAVIGLSGIGRETAGVDLSARLESLPMRMGGWVGEVAAPPKNAWWSGADEQLSRRYTGAEGEVLEVYVAYFRSQRQDKEVTSYRNADLHRQAVPVIVPLPGGQILQANFVGRRDERGQTRLFWYEIDGYVETVPYRTKLRTLWNVVRYGRSNAAVVMLSSAAGKGPAATVSEDVQQFVALLCESLGRVLPHPRANTEPRILAAAPVGSLSGRP